MYTQVYGEALEFTFCTVISVVFHDYIKSLSLNLSDVGAHVLRYFHVPLYTITFLQSPFFAICSHVLFVCTTNLSRCLANVTQQVHGEATPASHGAWPAVSPDDRSSFIVRHVDRDGSTSGPLGPRLADCLFWAHEQGLPPIAV